MTPLKAIRIRRGLKQVQVARDLRIDNGTYCRIENASVTATPAVAARIAKYFGDEVTRLQILYPEEYMLPEPDEQKAS